jgi:hypothetical protein
MGGRNEKTSERWYNDGYESCAFFLKDHEWVDHWYGMSEQRYRYN